jgi:hypothetical protein
MAACNNRLRNFRCRSQRNDSKDSKNSDSGDAAEQSWIMEEGERDDRMFIGPGPPERLSALSVFHSKSVVYGAFVWARRALNS